MLALGRGAPVIYAKLISDFLSCEAPTARSVGKSWTFSSTTWGLIVNSFLPRSSVSLGPFWPAAPDPDFTFLAVSRFPHHGGGALLSAGSFLGRVLAVSLRRAFRPLDAYNISDVTPPDKRSKSLGLLCAACWCRIHLVPPPPELGRMARLYTIVFLWIGCAGIC